MLRNSRAVSRWQVWTRPLRARLGSPSPSFSHPWPTPTRLYRPRASRASRRGFGAPFCWRLSTECRSLRAKRFARRNRQGRVANWLYLVSGRMHQRQLELGKQILGRIVGRNIHPMWQASNSKRQSPCLGTPYYIWCFCFT